MSKYKICVYAITKNEEKFVDRWMDSMKEADLVVVTDTGSTDSTVQRLRDRGAVVFVEEIKPWRFDVARNKSLDNVPDDVDICVCTDLDEVFTTGWRQHLEDVWEPDTNTARYLYNFSLKPDGTPDIQFTYFKIHKKKDYRWVYPIHEIIRYYGPQPEKKVFIDGILLNHYPDLTKSRSSYLTLLETAAEENPEDDRIMHYLGREYMFERQWSRSIATLEKHLALKSATWLDERCASMRWIAECYDSMGKQNEALRWYYRAIAEAPYLREPYIECARMAYSMKDWVAVFFMTDQALKISSKSTNYVNMGYCWDFTPNDLAGISCYWLEFYERCFAHAEAALEYSPNDDRLQNNLAIIKSKLNKSERKDNMKLVHTLLCLFRQENFEEDKLMANNCLKSLENSAYNTVVVYNQGFLSNEEVENFLKPFNLQCTVIGDGKNIGTSVGRQSCFEYIWEHYPDTELISEIHMDMIFSSKWEEPLVEWLDDNDEPFVSSAIINKSGIMPFVNEINHSLPNNLEGFEILLQSLKTNNIVEGFNNPCVHVSKILREIGGYDYHFLTGKQVFEDDSMLLGYYYYYGTKRNWCPKVNCNSVVYHATAGQRLFLCDKDDAINFEGLIRQYGALGLKNLSILHRSLWHRNFFDAQYKALRN